MPLHQPPAEERFTRRLQNESEKSHQTKVTIWRWRSDHSHDRRLSEKEVGALPTEVASTIVMMRGNAEKTSQSSLHKRQGPRR